MFKYIDMFSQINGSYVKSVLHTSGRRINDKNV